MILKFLETAFLLTVVFLETSKDSGEILRIKYTNAGWQCSEFNCLDLRYGCPQLPSLSIREAAAGSAELDNLPRSRCDKYRVFLDAPATQEAGTIPL